MSSEYNNTEVNGIYYRFSIDNRSIHIYYPIKFDILLSKFKPVYFEYLNKIDYKNDEDENKDEEDEKEKMKMKHIEHCLNSMFESKYIDHNSFNNAKLFNNYLFNKRLSYLETVCNEYSLINKDIVKYILNQYISEDDTEYNSKKLITQNWSDKMFYHLKYNYSCNEYFVCVIIKICERVGNAEYPIEYPILEEAKYKLKYLLHHLDIPINEIKENDIYVQFIY